ncbi:MAG: EF-hand domain-containing protein [Alphaproteobacteria bacterium]|jgi:Ca2+-binding EF-hand superfamily protein
MNSKASRTLFLASVVALGTAGLANAQPAPGPGPQGMPPNHMHQMHQMHHGQRGDGMMGFAVGEAFARADANNDGKVTREEANAWLAARFAEIDANKDGGLTAEEIRAFYTARRGEGRGPPEGMRERMEDRQAARFRFIDADLDGKITLHELRVMADAMFRSMDADGDGALTRAEVQRRGRRTDGPRAQPPAQPAPR